MADQTFPEDAGFSLIPASDEDLISADAQLAAAETSVTDDPFSAAPTQTPQIPFGRSWAFDRVTGRFIRIGGQPAEVRGVDALQEWIRNALATAQGACPIFSDDFGMEDPDDWIGVADPTDALSTFEPRAKEALRQHDRIVDLDLVSPEYDPSTGIITIDNINVITDQDDAVPLQDFEVAPSA